MGDRGTDVRGGDGATRVRPARARRAAALLVAVLAAAGLVGCGGGSAKTTAADSGFLSEVHDADPSINGVRSDVQLERLGHAVCDGFSAGASYQQLADRLALQAGSRSLPSSDLGAVIMAAADNYCPQFRNRV